jgi:hypothetical protein
MTTMTFTLSPTLLSELKSTAGVNNGVYLYAFAFGNPDPQTKGSTTVELPPITMISGGAVQGASSFSIDLNQLGPNFASGNVVVVLQQTGSGGTSNLISEVAASGGGIGYLLNTLHAQAENFRYDAIEATIEGSPTDAADLTDVVQFGSTMQLSVGYTGGLTQTRSYNVTGDQVVSNLTSYSPPGVQQQYTWSTTTTGPLTGQRETLGLATDARNSENQNPLVDPAYWANYVGSNGTSGFEQLVSGSGSPVYIANFFNGASGPSGGPPSMCYFQVEYDSTNGGTFWLVPVEVNTGPIAQTPYTIGITVSQLEDNIVAQTGQLSIYQNKDDATPYQTFTSFTPNNAYGDVTKYFVAGFDAGFWGGSANSINPLDTSNYSLNQTWNWSAPYAYQPSTYGYANSIGTGPGYNDQFAGYLFNNTNAYGYSYSDLISNGGGVNPLISLWDPNANSGAGANVSNIGVTLYDLGDTPSGYTAPQPNYVSGTLAANTLASGLQLDIDLTLSVTGASVGPPDGTPVTFRVYDPGGAGVDAQGFLDFSIPDLSGIYTISDSPGSGWQIASPGNPSTNVQGYFIINGIPVVNPTTPSAAWYQIVVGNSTTGNMKAYNWYLTPNAGATQWVSSTVDGAAVAQVITATPANAKFVANSGGNITYSPSFWGSGTSASFTPQQTLPSPLVGNIADDDSFSPFLDVSKVNHGEVAFSWSPESKGANRVVGGYYVKLNLANRDHSDWIMMPLVTQSPVNGDWMTSLSAQFGNGDYSAFMSQYKFKDPGLTTPAVASSVPVNFTVKLDNLLLVAADGGTALGFGATGSTTDGNWIELQALRSTLPNGTLIAYATDANGNLVDRDDGHTGPDVTFQDAVLGRFGVVKDDHGGLMSAGDDAVYLKVGEQLHFGLETGNGSLKQLPAVQISGSGGAFNVTVGGADGLLQFAAAVNNDLSANDALAAAQRTTDEPWVYLTQGSTVQVEAEGSAFYANTVHFVRIDVDPNSGAWSVGGVAYGNTDAFRAAVQQNWDQGLALTDGHGTFHDDESWTVAGKSGFYAPVLSTQAGDTFVIGNANVDGRDHIRSFGGTTFGFEDTPAGRGSDFDYNDMVVKLTVNSPH